MIRPRLRRMVAARDKGVCFYCHRPAQRPTYDHVRPRRCGGRSSVWNVVTACDLCNREKGGRFDREAVERVIAQTCRYLASIP